MRSHRSGRSSASAGSSTTRRCTTSRSSAPPTALTEPDARRRSACSARLRMDYAKAIRSVRGAAFELSRFVERDLRRTTEPRGTGRYAFERMATTERDYYDVLGLSRTADERDDQERLPPARARAPSGRVGRNLTPSSASSEVVEAYEVLSKAETRRAVRPYGHAGLRSGGFQPSHFDFGNLSDLFSAFFGDDLFGASGGRGGRRRGADIAAEIEIELVEAATRDDARGLVPGRRACSTCHGSGAEPGTDAGDVPDLRRARAPCSRSSRTVFGEFVRIAGRARTCGGPGTGRRASLRGLQRGRPAARGPRRSTSRSRRESTTGSASASRGEGHAGPLGGRCRRRLRRSSASVPIHASCARATTSFSTVDLTMTQAALGATRDGADDRRRARSSTFEPGTQPGEIRVLRGQGNARAPGLRTRRPPRPRQRHHSAPARRRGSAPARGVRARLRATRRYAGGRKASSTS